MLKPSKPGKIWMNRLQNKIWQAPRKFPSGGRAGGQIQPPFLVPLVLLMGFLSLHSGSSLASGVSSSLQSDTRKVKSKKSVVITNQPVLKDKPQTQPDPPAERTNQQEGQQSPEFIFLGGGYNPMGSQVSIERNGQLFQKTMQQLEIPRSDFTVLFGGGKGSNLLDVAMIKEDLQPVEELLSMLLGQVNFSLGLQFRHHRLGDVDGPNKKINFQNSLYQRSKSTRPLRIYYTGHGRSGGENHSNNTLNLWREDYDVQTFTRDLDTLAPGRNVQVLMVQCFSGGFGQINSVAGKLENWPSEANRCGFFSQRADLPASGCYYQLSNTQEYSIYFFEAYGIGPDPARLKQTMADFNGDGQIGSNEAHHYVLQNLQSPDQPQTTSDQLLRYMQSSTSLQGYKIKDLLKEASPLEKKTLDLLAGDLDLNLKELKVVGDLNKQREKIASNWLELTNKVLQRLEQELLKSEKKQPRSWHRIQEGWDFRELRTYLQDRYPFFTTALATPLNQDSSLSYQERLGILQEAILNHKNYPRLLRKIQSNKILEDQNIHQQVLQAKLKRLEYLLKSIALRVFGKKDHRFGRLMKRYEQLKTCEAEPFFPPRPRANSKEL